jgi:predicted transcriptional regulator
MLGGAFTVFPVVDANGALCGIVMAEEVRILLLDDSLEHVVNAGDIMRPPVFVAETDHLARAVELMRSSGLQAMPVVDSQSRVVCLVSEAVVAKAYWRKSAPKSLGGD